MNVTAAVLLALPPVLFALALVAMATWHNWTSPACRAARARISSYGSESLAEPLNASE